MTLAPCFYCHAFRVKTDEGLLFTCVMRGFSWAGHNERT
jgi:hypothetical protein